MKKFKYLIINILLFMPLFFINGIYCYMIDIAPTKVNEFSIKNTTTYTVIHQKMDTNGTTYTPYSENTYEVPLGTTVTPEVDTHTGFISPAAQTVTLNSYENTVITYSYVRKQYRLTITNDANVTTETPTGNYYYGKEIILDANAYDVDHPLYPFLQWTNGETNTHYVFNIESDTTIGPEYQVVYQVTYEPNNGEQQSSTLVLENENIGSFPDVTNNDCELTEGSLDERNCTYYYEFLGWYKEPEFVHKVSENFVPTEDITLYAKWNKIYFHQDSETFNNDHLLDTGVSLFNKENNDKDFIVSFIVSSKGSNIDRAVIFADMNETGEPYPGVNFRLRNSGNSYNINANIQGKKKNDNINYQTGNKVVLKRENGKFYYSLDGGTTFTYYQDFSNFTAYFDTTASFGGNYDENGVPWRFFNGTITDMTVELKIPERYTIRFDANGGSGSMGDQVVSVGKTEDLYINQFEYTDHTFNGWNTDPEGNGDSYTDGQAITDLGVDGELITLYAQWVAEQHYYVHFDANGGTGSMADQRFKIGASAEPLTQNAFTRSDYEFRGWNTQPDGLGTHYDDQEAVQNLSTTDEDIVTLYAEWWKIQYINSGDIVFDGTENTFIDTGINLFDDTNMGKDFEIRFTFKSVDSDQLQYTNHQPTIFNVKDETNDRGPGFTLRFQDSNISRIAVVGKWANTTSNAPMIGSNIATNNAPIEFVFSRKGGVVTYKYSYGNYESQEYTILNQNNWTLNQPFATNVTFGGYYNGDFEPGRFFKGTLADIIILTNN